MIFVELDHADPWPVGTQVAGHAIWDPSYAGSDRARAILVNLRWRTEGRGDRNSAVVQSLTIPFTAGPPRQITRFPFRFSLPPDGPVSYHGYLIRVIWDRGPCRCQLGDRLQGGSTVDRRATGRRTGGCPGYPRSTLDPPLADKQPTGERT